MQRIWESLFKIKIQKGTWIHKARISQVPQAYKSKNLIIPCWRFFMHLIRNWGIIYLQVLVFEESSFFTSNFLERGRTPFLGVLFVVVVGCTSSCGDDSRLALSWVGNFAMGTCFAEWIPLDKGYKWEWKDWITCHFWRTSSHKHKEIRIELIFV